MSKLSFICLLAVAVIYLAQTALCEKKFRSQEFAAFRKCIKEKCETEKKAFGEMMRKNQPECVVTCREKNPKKDGESRKAFFKCLKESNCKIGSGHKTTMGSDEAKAFMSCKQTKCQAELDAFKKTKPGKDAPNNPKADNDESDNPKADDDVKE